MWWRWYYWACPVSWTLYGMIVSQFGDYENHLESGLSVKEFLKDYFGFKHDFLGAVAAAEIAFPVLFAAVFSFGIMFLNFQRR